MKRVISINDIPVYTEQEIRENTNVSDIYVTVEDKKLAEAMVANGFDFLFENIYEDFGLRKMAFHYKEKNMGIVIYNSYNGLTALSVFIKGEEYQSFAGIPVRIRVIHKGETARYIHEDYIKFVNDLKEGIDKAIKVYQALKIMKVSDLEDEEILRINKIVFGEKILEENSNFQVISEESFMTMSLIDYVKVIVNIRKMGVFEYLKNGKIRKGRRMTSEVNVFRLQTKVWKELEKMFPNIFSLYGKNEGVANV